MERCAVRFDPRTKLLLLVTMAIFVLGGTGGDIFGEYIPYFALLPFILFILSGRLKKNNRLYASVRRFLWACDICSAVCLGRYRLFAAGILQHHDQISAGHYGRHLYDGDDHRK